MWSSPGRSEGGPGPPTPPSLTPCGPPSPPLTPGLPLDFNFFLSPLYSFAFPHLVFHFPPSQPFLSFSPLPSTPRHPLSLLSPLSLFPHFPFLSPPCSQTTSTTVSWAALPSTSIFYLFPLLLPSNVGPLSLVLFWELLENPYIDMGTTDAASALLVIPRYIWYQRYNW